jgi:deazaflavin-dependent oxidoreductase (nitroreductase family)
MPIPRAVGRLNRIGFNRIARHVAPWLPGFGVVVHRGRKSGRSYRTPVNLMRSGTGYVIALTYGADTDWFKNVQAAGGCELLTRRRRVRVGSPRVFHDEARRAARPIERPFLRLLGVTDFVALEPEPTA